MKTMQFLTICLYYYGKEVLRNPGYAILLMALFFVAHKLGTGIAWILTLTV